MSLKSLILGLQGTKNFFSVRLSNGNIETLYSSWVKEAQMTPF